MENLYRQRTSTSLWFSLKRKKSLARPCISRYDRENVNCLVLGGRPDVLCMSHVPARKTMFAYLVLVFGGSVCLVNCLSPPYIRLKDLLDEPNGFGWGIDLPGFGASLRLTDIQVRITGELQVCNTVLACLRQTLE